MTRAIWDGLSPEARRAFEMAGLRRPTMIEIASPRFSDGPPCPPYPVGANAKPLDLTGKIFAWDGVQPVLFAMLESPFFYVALFSSAGQLRAFHARAGVSFCSIKQVDDGAIFMTSFDAHPDVKVVLDPHYLPNGRIRFTQVETVDA